MCQPRITGTLLFEEPRLSAVWLVGELFSAALHGASTQLRPYRRLRLEQQPRQHSRL